MQIYLGILAKLSIDRGIFEMALRRANRPELKEGLASGTITGMGIQTFERERKVGRDYVTEDITSYCMDVDVTGVTGESLLMRCFAGTNLNDEPVEVMSRGRKRYNRFTTLALTLGAVAEDDLEKVGEKELVKIEKYLDGCVGRKVSFKPIRKENGFTDVDLSTLIVHSK